MNALTLAVQRHRDHVEAEEDGKNKEPGYVNKLRSFSRDHRPLYRPILFLTNQQYFLGHSLFLRNRLSFPCWCPHRLALFTTDGHGVRTQRPLDEGFHALLHRRPNLPRAEHVYLLVSVQLGYLVVHDVRHRCCVARSRTVHLSV